MPDKMNEATPLEAKEDLIHFLEAGSKPKERWAIGTEHEKFGFHLKDHSPLPYEGPSGIRAMLEGMQQFGWQPVMEGDHIIALAANGASVSLEPGGQFELSGAPLCTLHETCNEVHTHLSQVKQVAENLGIGFIGVGFSPVWTLDETPIMPKVRYQIMREYMSKVGTLGRDMMFRSCTVQVNLDFESEADMVKKFRVGLALQPIVTALFANSPFTEGKPNGYLSYRSHIWTDTDADRTGMLPFVFKGDFGFEAYVDYALDVPMYFVYRKGRYINVAGQSFRDFMAGRLPGLPGEKPVLADWIDHLTTIFPEVRLKQFLEMRGADGGPWRRLCALPALWVGLLYDGAALDAAWNLVKDWSQEERQTLRDEVARTALKTPFRGESVRDIAQRVLEIAQEGLRARHLADSMGTNETQYLEELGRIAASGISPADELLAQYEGAWAGNVDRIFDEYSY